MGSSRLVLPMVAIVCIEGMWKDCGITPMTE